MQRLWIAARVCVAAALIAVAFAIWRTATNRGAQQPAEPFRIAGNLFYVGANDVTSFLITGPEGHVLIDGGYPGTAPMIMSNITTLGFDIRDVKVLVNSHAHVDHAGGLAELQKTSGAELWVSEGDADAIQSGGNDASAFLPYRILVRLGILGFPAPRVDHRFKDGATIRVGPIELTAHVTAGHTRGCTSWSFPVYDGDRKLRVVNVCSLSLLPGMRLVEPERYPGIRSDFERSFSLLRSLPADIWTTTHAKEFDRYRKFRERAAAKDLVAPFMDRKGYVRYLDSAEARFRKLLEDQQRRR